MNMLPWKCLSILEARGILVTHEPGFGHSLNPDSIQAMKLYGVTEKDMPPSHIRDLCALSGFPTLSFLVDPTLADPRHVRNQPRRSVTREPLPWWRRSVRAAR